MIYAEAAFFLFRVSILKPSKLMVMAIFVTNVKMRTPIAKMAVAILISVMDGREHGNVSSFLTNKKSSIK